jgi:hypothetical protein
VMIGSDDLRVMKKFLIVTLSMSYSMSKYSDKRHNQSRKNVISHKMESTERFQYILIHPSYAPSL